MAAEIFADTSGFYALLVPGDDRHEEACRIVNESSQQRRRFVTTDYVLDETATLLKARGHAHLLREFSRTVLSSRACRLEWTDSNRFMSAWAHFLKRLDHPWSFTDCVGFLVMKQYRIREALTKDEHFEQAGFDPLLK
jgi:predicted nucleic acid-binding protein